jgi:hypothetical protein
MVTQSKTLRTIKFNNGKIELVHPASTPGQQCEYDGLWYYCNGSVCKQHVIGEKAAEQHTYHKHDHDLVALCQKDAGDQKGFYRELA